MLIIRLQRVGRKNYAEFRVIVTEHTRGPQSANYLEMVGHYNPHTNTVTLKQDRIKHWIEKGAQVSDTVNNILVSEKVIKGEKINVLPKKTPITKEEEAPAHEANEEKATDEDVASAQDEKKAEEAATPAEEKKDDEETKEATIEEEKTSKKA